MKRLLRLMTPRSTGQWIRWFIAWLVLFNGVFFVALQAVAVEIDVWKVAVVGIVTCLPFLTAAALMLRLHLRLQRQLREVARRDLLTGLPNRRAFIEMAEAQLATRNSALLMIDVDRFKSINDTYGHGFGDVCLQQLAQHLRPVMPNSFLVSRLGGEEFAIMIFDAAASTVENVAARVVSGVRLRPPGSLVDIQVTCSVGVSLGVPGDNLSALMSHADGALYAAKEAGRARMLYADTAQNPASEVVTPLAS